MSEEEIKKLQEDYKSLQDEYKTLKELNDKITKENTNFISKIETLTNDKKQAEDRYTELFKQTILVTNSKENKEEPKEEENIKVEDLYII